MNLKTLAGHLGLSPTTVSRALNGYSDVSPETKKRVAEAAQKHGYRPNVSARRLATGKSSVIGFTFPTEHNLMLDPHFIEFLTGLTTTAAEIDYDIMISATQGQEVDVYRRLVRRGTVDLIVVSCVHLSEGRIEELMRLGIPFIVHGRTPSCESYAYLDIDNYAVFNLPAKMLLELGHRKIAAFPGQADRTFAIDRLKGLDDAMNEKGSVIDMDLVRFGMMTEENGYEWARDVLSHEDRPSAIMCSSVLLAKGVYSAVRELGLKVGSDISVTAHDDGLPTIDTAKLTPPLAVTRSPLRDAGSEIARMAKRYIDGAPIEELQTIWPVELMFRPSVGAPKAD